MQLRTTIGRWSLIKRIANSAYARLTVLVPVIGWLLLANDEIAQIIARMTGQQSAALISWKIYALHVGLSIFGVGVGLFYLICPAAVKNSKDFTDFSETDQRTITSTQLDEYSNILNDADRRVPTVVATSSLAFPQTGSENGRDTWLRRNQDLIFKTQYEFYRLEDERFPWARWSILAILGIGGFITFIPSLITISKSFIRLIVLFVS